MLTRLALTAATLAVIAAPAAAQTWKIDGNHSTATFVVRHMMVSNVGGSFGKVDGAVVYDGKNVAAASVNATIDATTITTNNEKRDAHLKSPDFFDVATHPTITFKSKRVEPAANGAFKLVGDLTMRGVTKEVVLDVTGPTAPVVVRGAERIGATATTTINRKDFGVNWSSTMDGGGVVVSDEVKINLELALVKQAS